MVRVAVAAEEAVEEAKEEEAAVGRTKGPVPLVQAVPARARAAAVRRSLALPAAQAVAPYPRTIAAAARSPRFPPVSLSLVACREALPATKCMALSAFSSVMLSWRDLELTSSVRVYGSGYPGVASRGVANLGFPFVFWPIVWGGSLGYGAAYLHDTHEVRPVFCGEYGR